MFPLKHFCRTLQNPGFSWHVFKCSFSFLADCRQLLTYKRLKREPSIIDQRRASKYRICQMATGHFVQSRSKNGAHYSIFMSSLVFITDSMNAYSTATDLQTDSFLSFAIFTWAISVWAECHKSSYAFRLAYEDFKDFKRRDAKVSRERERTWIRQRPRTGVTHFQ